MVVVGELHVEVLERAREIGKLGEQTEDDDLESVGGNLLADEVLGVFEEAGHDYQILEEGNDHRICTACYHNRRR